MESQRLVGNSYANIITKNLELMLEDLDYLVLSVGRHYLEVEQLIMLLKYSMKQLKLENMSHFLVQILPFQ